MKLLVDTSIWVDFYRGVEPNASELARAIRAGSVITCGPVVAELTAGAPKEQRDELSLALAALELAPLDFAAWRLSGELAQDLRQRGNPVPLVDLVIAVAARLADATVWTRDRDFARVAEVLRGFRLYEAQGA